MKTKQTKSIFVKAPSWLLAILVFILSAIVFVITDSIWTPRTGTGLKSYLIHDLIIVLGCFFIVKLNPKSIWYVPLICNALLIIAYLFEPSLRKGAHLIPISAGWILSVAVSMIAAKRADSNQKK